ncbi:MAG TPA: RNA pseudouridine synthase [Bacteriovoracaceae bacterium]|nr:RNA pseudouridine synthase [Bacteriovoracaceae bacterium]
MIILEVQLLEAEPSLKAALKNFGFSGQRIKKFFSAKQLNTPVKKHQILKLPIDFVNSLEINPNYEGEPCSILFENEDYLAVHKPRNIHSHPLKYSDTNTVLNWLVTQQRWDVLNVNQEAYDRGLLHRLDFETSGVLLLAKNNKIHLHFRENFNNILKKKAYLAIVEGRFDKEGRHRHFFTSSEERGKKQILSQSPAAQVAESECYKVMDLSTGLSLVLVLLKTGIRHQVRAQLSALGFPILGDTLYGGKPSDRLYLHSWLYQWDRIIEDRNAELFSNFLDLDSAMKMATDKIGLL